MIVYSKNSIASQRNELAKSDFKALSTTVISNDVEKQGGVELTFFLFCKSVPWSQKLKQFSPYCRTMTQKPESRYYLKNITMRIRQDTDKKV